MRIAQVAPLAESVPPRLYGGTERVVAYLTDELARRGHDVALFASGGSRSTARVVSINDAPLRLSGITDHVPYTMVALAEVFRRAQEFDVIHCHVDYLAFPFSALVPTPIVHTLHGRLDLPHFPVLFRTFPTLNLVAISYAHRGQAPAAHWQGVIHHGLPQDLYRFHARPGRYLVFLGRVSPEKRPDLAIEVATRVGIPLKIAAKVDPMDRTYFEREIRHRLDHPLVEYLGEVDEEGKEQLLGDALGLIFPIDWPEPFGLTVIEALACGTPVVARPFGSVPELLLNGITGFLASTVDGLVEGVRRLETLDRAACRLHFERFFTAELMASKYEAMYAYLAQPAPSGTVPRSA